MRSVKCEHCSGIAVFGENDPNDFTATCQSCTRTTDGTAANALMNELEMVLGRLGSNPDAVKEWRKFGEEVLFLFLEPNRNLSKPSVSLHSSSPFPMSETQKVIFQRFKFVSPSRFPLLDGVRIVYCTTVEIT
jgi:hypothetical protein